MALANRTDVATPVPLRFSLHPDRLFFSFMARRLSLSLSPVAALITISGNAMGSPHPLASIASPTDDDDDDDTQ